MVKFFPGNCRAGTWKCSVFLPAIHSSYLQFKKIHHPPGEEHADEAGILNKIFYFFSFLYSEVVESPTCSSW